MDADTVHLMASFPHSASGDRAAAMLLVYIAAVFVKHVFSCVVIEQFKKCHCYPLCMA